MLASPGWVMGGLYFGLPGPCVKEKLTVGQSSINHHTSAFTIKICRSVRRNLYSSVSRTMVMNYGRWYQITIWLREGHLINYTYFSHLCIATHSVFLFAPLMQLENFDEAEYRALCQHLGHTLDVHERYYRLRHTTSEITKVAKMLMGQMEVGLK